MKQKAFLITLMLGGLCGCSGAGSSPTSTTPTTLTGGNWLFYVNSNNPLLQSSDPYPKILPLRGFLSVSSNSIASDLSTNNGIGIGCFSGSISLAGTVKSDGVTLTPTPNNSSLTITASVKPGGILLGTYTCLPSATVQDDGTVFATYVPPVTGSWSATLPGLPRYPGGTPPPPTALTAAFVQSITLSPPKSANQNTFALDGTLTVTNSVCFPSGPVTLAIDNTRSYVVGERFVVNAVSADLLTSFYSIGQLSDPTSASQVAVENGFLNGNGNGICQLNLNPNIPGSTGITLNKL